MIGDRKRFFFFRRIIFALVLAVAVSVLLASLWMPVLRIYGSTMAPILKKGDIVVAVKGREFTSGDMVAFNYNNKILIRRVIAQAGEWVNIDEKGTVWVNNTAIDEPYISESVQGEADIEFPYRVPKGKFFVLGDNRKISIDSRNTAVGCVSKEQIVGKLVFRVWPFTSFRILK